MLRLIVGTALVATALAGCAGVPPEPPDGAPDRACVPLFEEFDRLARFHDPARLPEDSQVVPSALANQSRRLLQAGCITTSGDLAGIEAVSVAPVTDSGAAIAPAVIHVGAVTNMADDARALAYFQARGLRAYSVGNPALGRRVYVGPVATAGAAAGVADAAREAGFVAPYVVHY
jgi:hypothetical protein